MHPPVPAELELAKNELRTLETSGFFDRTTHLWHLLEYVCNKNFEGEADQLKEYNIAVDVFGRGPEFDKKRDSIVRVEAHRLRKRLQQYYAEEGADHPIHIVLAPGYYSPRFIVQRDIPAAHTPIRVAQGATWGIRRPLALSAFALVVISIVVGYWYIYHSATQRSPTVSAANTVDRGGASLPGDVIRIMAGSHAGRQLDSTGRGWSADTYYTDGDVVTATFRTVLRTKDATMFLTRREGNFRYDIPLKPGWYEMRLFFAETVYGADNGDGGGETSRLFRLLINGKAALDWFDVTADAAGANTADVKVFKQISPAPDGFLHLQFVSQKERAFVNAIEIVEGDPVRLRPIRFVARESAFTDNLGKMWLPEAHLSGGRLTVRQQAVTGAADPGIFQSERYGNFSYAIPVAPGKYTVIAHFAETWYGPDRPGGGGIGSRSFNLYCNGLALLKNFDIFKVAGGSYKAIEKRFPGLQANAQGKLELSFVPEKNYACVNAIEVLDEGSSDRN